MEFWSVRLTLAWIVSLPLFRILCCIFYCSCDIFIRQCFRSNWEVKALCERLVSIWVNCLEDILISHLFWSVILGALRVTVFLLISSLNFRICLFFVKLKDFLYKFSWFFYKMELLMQDGTPKILPFNCLMLFLSLSHLGRSKKPYILSRIVITVTKFPRCFLKYGFLIYSSSYLLIYVTSVDSN